MLQTTRNDLERYANARQQLPDAGAISLLIIDAERSAVVSGNATEPAAVLEMHIGDQRSARELLRHTPPQRAEFEMAIEPLEDEIIRIHRAMQPDSLLVGDSAALREIAELAGVAPSEKMRLSLDAMERVFSRLAAVINGKPASSEGIPEDNAFAIRLVILREFMHHLGFAEITVLAPAQAS